MNYPLTLTLFFTNGVSLKTWAETGLLLREIRFYHELMLRYGIQVQFITYGDKSDRDWGIDLQGIVILPVYERLPRLRYKFLSLLQTLLIPWFFRRELRLTNLIKTNQIWGGWVAVLTKWIFGKPLLVRCGFEAYKSSLEAGKRNAKHLALKWCSDLSYKQADHILLSTQEISEFVKSTFQIPADRVTVSANWIETSRFVNFQSDKYFSDRVLFVGRLSKVKNIPLLIRALAGTRIDLDIIGSGDLQEELENIAVKLKVKVNFLGVITNEQMPEVYNRYPVYVLCSRLEGNPKSLLEAMSCECAVVGTDVSGIRDIIQNNVNGLLVPEEEEALKSAILRLCSNDALRNKLGKKARQNIIKFNSLDATLEKEYILYKRLTDIQLISDF